VNNCSRSSSARAWSMADAREDDFQGQRRCASFRVGCISGGGPQCSCCLHQVPVCNVPGGLPASTLTPGGWTCVVASRRGAQRPLNTYSTLVGRITCGASAARGYPLRASCIGDISRDVHDVAMCLI
jgi:hypothetical protein